MELMNLLEILITITAFTLLASSFYRIGVQKARRDVQKDRLKRATTKWLGNMTLFGEVANIDEILLEKGKILFVGTFRYHQLIPAGTDMGRVRVYGQDSEVTHTSTEKQSYNFDISTADTLTISMAIKPRGTQPVSHWVLASEQETTWHDSPST